ncbi:DNA polymerase-3 subunit epsilon [Rhizobium sp. RU36D]|nr:DNA polymerase-3 subunit epsilon [Rhizobium sp. RU36D]
MSRDGHRHCPEWTADTESIVRIPANAYSIRMTMLNALPALPNGKTIAIDFETANEERGSACSVGLAWIEDGRVVRVEERLIRPRSMRFSSFNIAIHGIRPEHVEDAPEFPEVMDEFADDFAGATMIAHNAAFDFSVWRSALDSYRQAYPQLSYLCSVKMAQRLWPHLTSHRLNVLADHLGLMFRHHNAAEDAAICAEASIAMARQAGVSHVAAIAGVIGMRPGRLYAGGYEACSCRRA